VAGNRPHTYRYKLFSDSAEIAQCLAAARDGWGTTLRLAVLLVVRWIPIELTMVFAAIGKARGWW